jgi:hypothetical protein
MENCCHAAAPLPARLLPVVARRLFVAGIAIDKAAGAKIPVQIYLTGSKSIQ